MKSAVITERAPGRVSARAGLKDGDRRRERRHGVLRGAARCALDATVLTVVGTLVARAAGIAAIAAIGMSGTLMLLAVSGQYIKGSSPSLGEAVRVVTGASAIAIMGAVALMTALGADVGAGGVAALWLAALAGLVTVRATLAAITAQRWLQGVGTRRVLIVGAGRVSRLAARRLSERPALGLQPIGFLDLRPREGSEDDPAVLGASWDLEQVVREHDVDTVLIGFSSAPHEVLLRIVHRCRALGSEVLVVPRLFEVQGMRSRTKHVGGLPLVSLEASPHTSAAHTLKAVFERVFAGLLLFLLTPLLAVIAALVKLTSEGPVLHRAPRVGLGGQPFPMLKFRTMLGEPEVRGETHADWAAESVSSNMLVDGLEALPSAVTADLRTPIGRVLRRTALDELPQLWNVLRGDMSLVGPRPELVSFVDLFSPVIYRYDSRHRVRPGITGWAQVQGLRGKTSLEDRVEWDNFYIENWSLGFDLKILALTMVALLRHNAD